MIVFRLLRNLSFFFFIDTAPPEIYPLPLHAALPISRRRGASLRSPLCLRRARLLICRRRGIWAAATRSPVRRNFSRESGPPCCRASRRRADEDEQIGRAHV